MKLSGKKVLVTGAGGFIGSHLTEALVKEGCDVKAFIRYSSRGHKGWLEGNKDVEFFLGDIRDPHGVKEAVKGCDVIFHLAALIGIPFSYHSPDSYVDTNVKGTLNVLQAARDVEVEKVLITSTSEVYGTALYTPMDEKHPLQGQSPYSATKIAADKLAEAFYRSFDLPVSTVRPFNTYGPRQSMRAVIPTIIMQSLSRTKEIHIGNLEAKRDFVYVDDTVSGFIEIAKSDLTVGEEINIATGAATSITELLLTIPHCKEIKVDDIRIRPGKSEVSKLCGDSRKLHTLTGWRQKHTLRGGLFQTKNWFTLNKHLYKDSEVYHI